MASATDPLKTSGLFDAAKAGGQTFDEWNATSGGTTAMPSIAPEQVDDSMANKVADLTSQDSKLNQMARTEGLKAANSRGLLNSSMAVGAAQDAVLKNAIPIASQDSAQDFARNQAARAFEYSIAGQDDAQAFTAGEAQLDRNLELLIQQNSLTAAEAAQIREIASTEGMAAADRALQEKLAGWDVTMQREDRALQEKLAGWDVTVKREAIAADERNAAATFITNIEQIYNSSVQAIMANTNLSEETRGQQLEAAKQLRDYQLDFVQQIYTVQLDWGQAR